MIYTPIGTFRGVDVYATESEPGDVLVIEDPEKLEEPLRTVGRWIVGNCADVVVMELENGELS